MHVGYCRLGVGLVDKEDVGGSAVGAIWSFEGNDLAFGQARSRWEGEWV